MKRFSSYLIICAFLGAVVAAVVLKDYTMVSPRWNAVAADFNTWKDLFINP